MENISGTVNKAFDLLEVFLKGPPEMGLTELSSASGHNNTVIHRLLATMVKRGVVHHSRRNGKYSLGLKILELSDKVRLNLRYLDTIYLHMSKLCRDRNVAVDVTALDGDLQIVVDEIGIVNDFRFTAPVGKTLPLHATACGKVFLAYMPKDLRDSFFERHPPEKITEYTVTDRRNLNRQLEKIKKDGVAFDQQEYAVGLWAVSAPVFNGKGEVVCAPTIVLPASQVNAARSRDCANSLKKSTAELSMAMGRIV